MLKSMTGYGRGEGSWLGGKCTVEIKTVNHRYCEVLLRLPRQFAFLEERIRGLVQSRVARGRVEVFLTVETSGGSERAVKVDKDLAFAYYKAMKELQESLGIEGKIKVKHLISLPGVLACGEPEDEPDTLWPPVKEALEEALDNLVKMRCVEGERLARDIAGRLEKVSRLNSLVRDRAPLVLDEYREKLKQRAEKLLDEGTYDPARLEAEAVFFAERSNITEETVRLESHLKQAESCLEAEEPVGRKLDFLLQEMNREANTIASKAADAEISRLVVEIKSELEKVREQVQNIE